MKPTNIKIGGKQRPVFFGFSALRKLEELSGITVAELESVMANPSIDFIIKFIFSGLYGGARKKHIPIEFEMDQVEDWLDDYGFENLPKLMEIYMTCMPQASPANTQAPKKGK